MWRDVERRRADHRDHQRRPRPDLAGRAHPRRARRRPTSCWATHQTLKARAARRGRDAAPASRLDPDVLTIGFARRAAAYKRSDLILRDRARIAPLLDGRRLQLVFAGKAHPTTTTGKAHHRRAGGAWRGAIPEAVVFVPDYDMALGRAAHARRRRVAQQPAPPARGERHVRHEGRDERRAQPARSSTAGGRRAASTASTAGRSATRPAACPSRTRATPTALYAVLESEVLPAYADRARWVGMMQASIAMASERFSSDRMVRDYFEQLYAR